MTITYIQTTESENIYWELFSAYDIAQCLSGLGMSNDDVVYYLKGMLVSTGIKCVDMELLERMIRENKLGDDEDE